MAAVYFFSSFRITYGLLDHFLPVLIACGLLLYYYGCGIEHRGRHADRRPGEDGQVNRIAGPRVHGLHSPRPLDDCDRVEHVVGQPVDVDLPQAHVDSLKQVGHEGEAERTLRLDLAQRVVKGIARELADPDQEVARTIDFFQHDDVTGWLLLRVLAHALDPHLHQRGLSLDCHVLFLP